MSFLKTFTLTAAAVLALTVAPLSSDVAHAIETPTDSGYATTITITEDGALSSFAGGPGEAHLFTSPTETVISTPLSVIIITQDGSISARAG
ncbi:hypothetical protein [Leucobacter salsicius]|uniref:hypothetical protein n=1 Tax=Leucobacter salsicius TaxID=664638 RepID=UPI0003498CF0|nr:hypothetical protein [Leucobacter salsicius]